jgi:hypothetical protein
MKSSVGKGVARLGVAIIGLFILMLTWKDSVSTTRSMSAEWLEVHFPVVYRDGYPPTATATPIPAGRLLITEVMYDPEGDEPEGEWIEICNVGNASLSLNGHKIGDAYRQGENEGMMGFPASAMLGPGEVMVIAHEATTFTAQYGFKPDFEMIDSDPAVPDLFKYAVWAGRRVSLTNQGDEVLILDDKDGIVDGLAWGQTGSDLFNPPIPVVPQGHSLDRNPAILDTDTAADWVDQANPNPGWVEWSTPTPTATATSSIPPEPVELLLSEVMVDPLEEQPAGEWIEVYNFGLNAGDLAGYQVGDEETEGGGEGMLKFPPGAVVDPGGAIVVANQADVFLLVYGFAPDYEITDSDPTVPDMIKNSVWASGSINLANDGDEVLVLDRVGGLVDAVCWGDSTYAFEPAVSVVAEGHSIERFPPDLDTDRALDWREQPNPNPSGVDLSTPTPTPTPTATGTPTPTPTPTGTPTSSATPTITPTPVAYLVISELYYDTIGEDSDQEWIEIYNPTDYLVDLSDYKVGDEETQGGNEGMFQFPSEASIVPGGKIIVALKATGFDALYGFKPDYEIHDSDPTVPDLAKYSAWGSGSAFALSNTGDEVLLLDGEDDPVDVVVYEGGSAPGIVPHPGVSTGHSIERSPPWKDTDDCSIDFIDRETPTPG